ncbi:MAG: patatin-like phospholipase family protein, partial [Acidobacteriota bacterium]
MNIPRRLNIFALLLLSVSAIAQMPDTAHDNGGLPTTKHVRLPAPVPAYRPTVGLALEGGGALGIAHIGVIRWLEENHIPVDRLGGTSMGALIGGLYASGMSPAEIARIVKSANFDQVFTSAVPYSAVGIRRREDREELPGAVELGMKNGLGMGNSLFQDRVVNSFLQATFDRTESTNQDYNALPIPFRCVATDLTTLQPVVFDSGPLFFAVRASIA